jgi:uncharacterized protein YbaR (Trm112 family)
MDHGASPVEAAIWVLIAIAFIIAMIWIDPYMSGGLICEECDQAFAFSKLDRTAICPHCGRVYRVRR